MRNKKLFLAFLICVIFSPLISWAGPFDYTPMEKIPGSDSVPMTDFYVYIQAVYKFGIWAVGIAALLMISIGGYMYITSAGNNSSMEKAKSVVTDAIIGLILALTAYLLLYVINPDLVKIVKLPTVSAPVAPIAPPTGPPVAGACTGANAACCKTGTNCTDCSNCTSYSNSYSNLCYKGATGNTGCQLNSSLKSKLDTVNWSAGGGAQVSETWPPTVTHSAQCHSNGTCADVRCNSGCSNTSVANVKAIYDALKAAGLNVLFETTPGSCQPYINAGVTNCSSPSTMTSPSFHVS